MLRGRRYQRLRKGVKMKRVNFRAPGTCPVCGERLRVVRLSCPRCGTEIAGDFEGCRFCGLEEKHLRFVETFLRCRGSIKEVERTLGLSYPTVKNMLDAALSALGFSDTPHGGNNSKRAEQAEILERLQNKEMDVDSAVEALKDLRGRK